MNEEPDPLSPQGPASAAPAAETLAAILAEMRELAHGFANGEVCATARKVRQWVSRIEAAAKQEEIDAELKWTRIGYDERKAEEKRTPGNAAAMRAALERILDIEGYGAPWLAAKCIAQKALEGERYTPPLAKETAKIEQFGNDAAIREALEEALAYCESDQKSGIAYSDNDVLVPMLRAALSAPARNCDRFATPAEAHIAFQRFCRGNYRQGYAAAGLDGCDDCELCETKNTSGEDACPFAWLFAPAKENGGNKR